MGGRWARWLPIAFLLAWLVAGAIYIIGALGLFGQERDPLSGAYLTILGLPWNLLAGGLPDSALPVALVLIPAVNLLILWLLYRLLTRSHRV